jgi:hypothetical protein
MSYLFILLLEKSSVTLDILGSSYNERCDHEVETLDISNVPQVPHSKEIPRPDAISFLSWAMPRAGGFNP